MSGRLEGKVAVITGGTSGIGEATVRLFVQEGARVVFSGRSEEAGTALAAELGPSARFVRADVTREADVKATIDVAVEQFHYAMDLLLGSVIFGIKHAAPIMKAQGSGSIVNNSSVAALRSNRGGYLYSAAKAAVTHVSRLAAIELGANG